MKKTPQLEVFTEDKFLEKYKEIFSRNCKTFLSVPTKNTYLEFIQPYILTADNLYYMGFISHDTWVICFNLYSDVKKAIGSQFAEWDIESKY